MDEFLWHHSPTRKNRKKSNLGSQPDHDVTSHVRVLLQGSGSIKPFPGYPVFEIQ
jgi:hypothetical protein